MSATNQCPDRAPLIALADALGGLVDHPVGDQETIFEAVEFRKKAITGKKEKPKSRPGVRTFWSVTFWSRSCSTFPASWGIVRVRPPVPPSGAFPRPTAPPEAFETTGVARERENAALVCLDISAVHGLQPH